MRHDRRRWSHGFDTVSDDRGKVASLIAIVVFAALILALGISWIVSSRDNVPTAATAFDQVAETVAPTPTDPGAAANTTTGQLFATTITAIEPEATATTIANATTVATTETTTLVATTTSTPSTTKTTTTLAATTTIAAADFFCLADVDDTCTDPTGMVVCTLSVGDGYCRDETGKILCGISPESFPECIPGLDPRA